MAIGSRLSGSASRPSDADPSDDGRMSLAEHLGELRTRLIKAILAVAIGGALGFALYGPVLERLTDPYCEVKTEVNNDAIRAGDVPAGTPADCRLVVTDPLESFSIRLKLSAYLGLLFASPVVLWQLWRFITPGLYPNEKRYAIPFVLSSVALFVMGAALALWTFPKTLEFFAAIGGSDLVLLYTPGKYLGLLTFMMLAFGVGFEFPILLTFLQIAGILHWRRLSSWRRYAIVLIFVAGAVITPSGDPVTLLALGVPLCLFYEASILIGRFALKR